jgi:hypothetical protein
MPSVRLRGGRLTRLRCASFSAWCCPESPPDHSTISRTRRLIDLETHQAMFTWMLQRLADAGLVKGKTVGIEATTLEANAALRSIVRRDTGESDQDFLMKLAQASGIETPTRADLARVDRKRKKKGSNDDWTHPHDPDAKILSWSGEGVRHRHLSSRRASVRRRPANRTQCADRPATTAVAPCQRLINRRCKDAWRRAAFTARAGARRNTLR